MEITVLIEIIDSFKREIKKLPLQVRKDFIDSIAMLESGVSLSFPLSRPIKSVGRSISELRFSDENGIYRIIYFIKKRECIYIIHAFTKKTQKTPKRNIDLAIKRIKEFKMKTTKYKSITNLAEDIDLDLQVALVAEFKAKLTFEIIKVVSKKKLTHQEVAILSGLSRSSVTGVISGSLQRVSIDRLMRILLSLGKSVSIKVKDAA